MTHPTPQPLPPAPRPASARPGPRAAYDWAAVYLALQTAPTLYRCTQPQARACNSWTRYHHNTPTYYRQAPGGLILSLEPTQTHRVKPRA